MLVHFFQIFTLGNDIDLNIFMITLMTYVINKYTNLSETMFYLSIIIPTIVLTVTIIQIIICVESTRVFQYE